MLEIWKPVNGFEEKYEISNLGRIKNILTKKNLKPQKRGNYLKATLFKNKKRHQISIHRLVAQAFIENPNHLPCVNHKDCNTYNNKAENLEWCSYIYNCNYGDRNKKNAESKYKKINQYDLKGNYIATYNSIKEASEKLNIKHSYISKCVLGKRNKTKGYKFKYYE